MKEKIYRLLSMVITLAVVLTTCVCSVGTANANVTQAVYYVSPIGDDSAAGTDVTTPLKTVDGAIIKANAAGYGEGDTVYIKAIKTMDGDTEVPNIWKNTDSTSTLTTHAYKLNISSYSDKAKLGYAVDTVLGGDTEFSNITLVTEGYKNFCMRSNDVVFGSGTSFTSGMVLFVTSWIGGDPSHNLNYYFNCAMNATFNLGGIWSERTFNKDINVTVDNNGNSSFTMGDRASSSNYATFNRNINFNLKNTTAFNLTSTNNPKFGDNSAVQIINSTSNTALTGSAKNYVSTKSTVNNNPVTYYIINNALGKADAIEFTDTKGKFKINVDLEIYDILLDGEKVELPDGYLILENSGEYDITKSEKPGNELTYYVKNGTTGGNGDEKTPFGTVAEAVTAAKNAGLGRIDTLNVKLLDNSSLGLLPEYSFTSIIEPATDKVSLNIGENAIANGKTIYKNISLTADVIDLAGKDVTIDNNVDLTVSKINTINAKATINAKLCEVDILTGENANIIINNADTVAAIAFAEADYEKVKINLKSAREIDFSGILNATDTVEIAISSNTEISGLDYEGISAVNGKWYIDNKCNLEFNFTDIAGEFSYMGEKSVELIGIGDKYLPSNNLINAPQGKYEFNLKEFTMKPLDKGYVTFIFDDANMPFTKEVADLFEEFEMPMSCAVPAYKVKRCGELHRILLGIQANGGEILSHGLNHWAITSETTKATAEKQMGDAWRHLTSLGFNINGMIEVGNGGGEATADYEMVETISRKYYKYSNRAGVSEQYTKSRSFMSWDSMNSICNKITQAGDNNEWIILSAHGYGEISSDQATTDTTRLREILQYIKDKNGAVEVVTWNYMYENFAEYNGPQVATQEAIDSLNTYVDNISDKNITHEYDNACDSICNGCGYVRIVSEHQYDGPTDAECNECGFIRVIADGFIKEGGEYYYYKDGVKSTDTALVKVNGKWFYIEEGRWNKEFTDLHKLNGKWFYVKNGRWSPINDLVKYKGKWFFVRGGKWFSSDNTLFKKNGKWFSIQWGKWSKSTCIITYKGSKFYCKGGFAQLGFTGKAKVGSKTYTVVKGKIK